jgi:hypothetical protein
VSGSQKHLLLRTPVQITIWLLLLIVTLGPHHSLFVCTMGCCRVEAAAAPAEEAGCSCCAKKAENASGGSSERNRARGCHDCCIDVAMLTELGPMPRTVDCPDLDMPFLGEVPYAAEAGVDHGVDAPQPRSTGPPRPDRPTDLLATTILRQ